MSKATQPKVSVLVATHNRKAVFLKVLDSLIKSDYPDFEVIIADNASTDGLATEVRKKYLHRHANIILVQNHKNTGINGGRNAAQQKATGKYFFFMDSDIFVSRNLFSVAVAYFENHHDVGVIVPKLYFYEDPKRIWCAGTKLNMVTSIPTNVGFGEIDVGQYSRITDARHGPGAFFARADATRKAGGHDKNYFLCYADTDLCYKIIESGYKSIFLPEAVAYHDIKKEEIHNELSHYGFDTPRRTYYYARNRFLFMKNHANPLLFLLFLFVISPIFLLYFSFHIIRLNGKQLLKVYWKGFIDGWRYALTNRCENYE